MLGIQIIIAVFAAFAIARTLSQFGKKHISALWMLGWIIFWAVVILVTFLPQTTQFLANALGVGRGADLIIYVSLVALFYLLFRLFVKVESVEQEISQLVRKISLDEHHKDK